MSKDNYKSSLLTLLVISIGVSLVLGSCATGDTALAQETAMNPEPVESTPAAAESGATILPTASPAIQPTQAAPSGNRISEKDQMEMIFIPAGEFIMGCEGTDCTVDVLPGPYPDFMVQTVYLDDYWIDKYEVTNLQYNLCVSEGACRPCFRENEAPLNIPPQGKDYFTEATYNDYPVINVSWYMARDYCAWAGRRLPTEAEWEKAARGTDGQKYPWGNDFYLEEYANMCDVNCPSSPTKGDLSNPNFDDGYAGPSPIGSYPAGASPYGLLDMAGNVWEWTSTTAEPYPYDPNDGRESQYDIADGSKWPERILRGGPWSDGYAYLRSSYRYRAVAPYRNFNMGIRCAYSE